MLAAPLLALCAGCGAPDARPLVEVRTATARLVEDELAETRAHFEAGDLVGTARVAAAALADAETSRPQLLWYGARAALMLGDVEASEQWVASLRTAVGASEGWGETLTGFESDLAALREQRDASRAALTRARVVGLGGMVLLLGFGLWAGRSRATGPEARPVSPSDHRRE